MKLPGLCGEVSDWCSDSFLFNYCLSLLTTLVKVLFRVSECYIVMFFSCADYRIGPSISIFDDCIREVQFYIIDRKLAVDEKWPEVGLSINSCAGSFRPSTS